MGDGRIPDAQAVTATAHILAHDVEAEEREVRIVIDARDGRGGSAVQLADQEAAGIDGGEAGGIGDARIPSFGRCPVHGDRDFVVPHRPDAQFVRGGRSNGWAHEPISPRESRNGNRNDAMEPIIVRRSEFRTVDILGKVVGVYRRMH